MGYNGRHSAGFTLLEVLLATFILGIVALAAIPSLRSGGQEELDLAASELSSALRFARSEALRTGEFYGVGVRTDNETIRVRHIQTLGNPFNTQPTVYNPLDKQLYVQDLSALPQAGGVDIDEVQSTHSGVCARPAVVAFDPAGYPVCGEPTTVRITQWIAELTLGDTAVEVHVAAQNGRVTIE